MNLQKIKKYQTHLASNQSKNQKSSIFRNGFYKRLSVEYLELKEEETLTDSITKNKNHLHKLLPYRNPKTLNKTSKKIKKVKKTINVFSKTQMLGKIQSYCDNEDILTK